MKTITIEFSEYEKMVNDIKTLSEFYNNEPKENRILLTRQFQYIGMCGAIYNWNIVSKDELIKELVAKIDSLAESNYKLSIKENELNEILNRKKSFWS